jgi:hypothetical protein
MRRKHSLVALSPAVALGTVLGSVAQADEVPCATEEQTLQTAEKLAGQMSPEERAQVTQPPPPETIGATSQALVSAWGWPVYGGWGGMYSLPYYATGPSPFYGAGLGTGWGGLGVGGWYW